MKILLLGKDGQVGWELQRSLAGLGTLVAYGRKEADFEQPESLRAIVSKLTPDVIVNAAAYTAVDKAETEQEKAQLINVDAVAVLAEEAKKCGAWLIHYSTDYVFDGGKKSPYQETDPVLPLSFYGKTKLDGERAIEKAHDKYLIFRTSWVYGVNGNNFPKTMLRLAVERDALNVVNDQFGAPTSAAFIADVTALIIYKHLTHAVSNQCTGIYHLASGGRTNWYEYAKYVITLAQENQVQLKVLPEKIKGIPASEYKTPAKRPYNSSLDMTKFTSTFGIVAPDWQEQVRHFVKQITK
jgi:dTDP-4-dehydrorhamnose reductase